MDVRVQLMTDSVAVDPVAINSWVDVRQAVLRTSEDFDTGNAHGASVGIWWSETVDGPWEGLFNFEFAPDQTPAHPDANRQITKIATTRVFLGYIKATVIEAPQVGSFDLALYFD